MTTITIWGRRVREGSRRLQLVFFLFYFVLHTSVLLYGINTLADRSFLKADPSTFQGFCMAGLFCGLLSLPLFLGQIYTMDTVSTLTRLRNLASTI